MRHWIGFYSARMARMCRLMPAAIALTACLGVAEARATVVAGTFAGLIDHGTDYTGVFGTAGAALDGLAYVETFTYDTSKGIRATNSTADQVSVSGFGLDPVLTYALTINGVTDVLNLAGNTFVDAVAGHDFRLGGQFGLTTVFDIAYGDAFADLDHPSSYLDTVTGLGSPLPGFARASRISHGVDDVQYNIVFDTQRLDFAGDEVQSGVPEPTTWAMMLVGFAMAGGALRRRPSMARLRSA